MRPTCDQILAMDIVKKRISQIKTLNLDEIESEETFEHLNLLNTIKLPKNLANLTKDLPKSNYISNRGDSAIASSKHNNSKLI